VGIRCAGHATPSIRQKKLALTSPKCGGRSVGIVRSRIKATEFSYLPINRLVHVTETQCVFCDVGTRFLYAIYANVRLVRDKLGAQKSVDARARGVNSGPPVSDTAVCVPQWLRGSAPGPRAAV
jgi:hypothetical protein